MARYVLELALLDYRMITVRPSKLAAAATLWALLYLNKPGRNDWNASLEYHTSYQKAELSPFALQLTDIVCRNHQSVVTEKYSSTTFFQVKYF